MDLTQREGVAKGLILKLPLIKAMDHCPDLNIFGRNHLMIKRSGNKRPRAQWHVVTMATSLVMGRKTKSRRVKRLHRVDCVIKDTIFSHARIDDDSSLNILPTSVFDKLKLGPIRKSREIVQLVDRSIKRLRGTISVITTF